MGSHLETLTFQYGKLTDKYKEDAKNTSKQHNDYEKRVGRLDD